MHCGNSATPEPLRCFTWYVQRCNTLASDFLSLRQGGEGHLVLMKKKCLRVATKRKVETAAAMRMSDCKCGEIFPVRRLNAPIGSGGPSPAIGVDKGL
ncbi:jg18418 [Pararge aegeria aegeria]|uniref:Jg18418 protein n=1 Tax=Pararge aegeria aegeria TaxID=348720 RepID=A0A8S4SAI9_9NEOP|nr:jg18418 [Pararge aegeria aegeria]